MTNEIVQYKCRHFFYGYPVPANIQETDCPECIEYKKKVDSSVNAMVWAQQEENYGEIVKHAFTIIAEYNKRYGIQ